MAHGSAIILSPFMYMRSNHLLPRSRRDFLIKITGEIRSACQDQYLALKRLTKSIPTVGALPFRNIITVASYFVAKHHRADRAVMACLVLY